MTKVLVATDKPFAKAAVDGIREIVQNAGFELVLLEGYIDKADLLKAVADVDAVIVRSDLITKEVIEATKNLKIVVRAGAGYDNIDLEASTAKNVVVMNTPGQNANAVAELAFSLMLYHIRGGFAGKSGTELRGKKLGIQAYGNIGRYVAQIAKGFGMNVIAYDPYVNADLLEKDGVTHVDSVEELYAKCQYVSVNIPANKSTIKSIGYELLSKMPKGATLVNTARKEVVDEEGLQKIFAERADFNYVADVAPDCAADLAAKYPGKTLFTAKKMGAQTSEANINAGLAAARQIVKFIQKGDRTFQVNN